VREAVADVLNPATAFAVFSGICGSAAQFHEGTAVRTATTAAL